VAPSSQNLAMNALVFLYRKVLEIRSVAGLEKGLRFLKIGEEGRDAGGVGIVCFREFNMSRFSSVSGVVERMRGKISGDRHLRNCVG